MSKSECCRKRGSSSNNGGREEEGRSTPKGHFVVYVGPDSRRFVVSMAYLKKPCFQELLQESAEMYGFCNQKGIVLPCDEYTFRSVMYNSMKRN